MKEQERHDARSILGCRAAASGRLTRRGVIRRFFRHGGSYYSWLIQSPSTSSIFGRLNEANAKNARKNKDAEDKCIPEFHLYQIRSVRVPPVVPLRVSPWKNTGALSLSILNCPLGESSAHCYRDVDFACAASYFFGMY